jgi:hypothetical protein
MLFRFLDFETSPIANEEDGKIVLFGSLAGRKGSSNILWFRSHPGSLDSWRLLLQQVA